MQRDMLAVHERDNPVQEKLGTHLAIHEERLCHGAWVRKACRLYDDAVEFVAPLHQICENANEISAYGAADTSVVHLENLLVCVDHERRSDERVNNNCNLIAITNAALATPDAQGNYNVTLDNTVGANYTAFKLGADPLPWRSCLSSYTPPNNPQMGFDSLSVPYNPSGDPARSMRDYADYMTYNQSTQGHLNSDGLCFVERHYPSPP
jgi:hypothetical protein